MFIREWRGRAKQSDAARYPEYFRREYSDGPRRHGNTCRLRSYGAAL
jgi:hypothetical protein